MTRPIWGKHYRVIKGIGRLPEGVYAEGRRGRGGERQKVERRMKLFQFGQIQRKT